MNEKPKQKRKPLYRRTPGEKNIQLQERDREIIYEVFRYRFLNSRHITALVGGSSQRVLRRLQSLFHAGYLTRPLEQIRPYKTGSDPMVYGIGNKGAELLEREFEIPRGKIDWTRKNREVKQLYLDHSLMVANFMVCLRVACFGRKDVELIEYVGRKEKKKDPAAGWKVNVKWMTEEGDRIYPITVIPDRIFILFFPNDPPGKNKALFFLEADRSTMPVIRGDLYKSSFYKKLVGYWESYQQDKIQELFDFPGARMITIAKSSQRIDNIIEANKDVDGRKQGSRMFLFLCQDQINIDRPEQVLERVWRNGRDDELVSLLE